MLLGFSNDQVIASGTKRGHASAALLHSGMELWEMHTDTRGRANLIAKDSIFLAMDTVNATVAGAIEGRLIGSLVKLKIEQLTQLVLNQLT